MPDLQLSKIFCVIDPTTNKQRALDRAASVAHQTGAAVHAYLCFTLPGGYPVDSRDALREAEYARHRAWMTDIIAPLQSDGVVVTTEIECNEDWRGALVDAANRAQADVVMRASIPRSMLQRRVLKTADWTLLRGSHSPVLFVKSENGGQLDKVLAAINIEAQDAPHQALTALVLQYAKAVARLTGAELHVVNAYSGSRNFVHPPDLAKRVGVERRQAHVGDASPDELISEVSEKLGNPLVVIGSIPRAGMAGGIVGNTAERILDHIHADVLCIVQQPA
jgi:universal stress protein E